MAGENSSLSPGGTAFLRLETSDLHPHSQSSNRLWMTATCSQSIGHSFPLTLWEECISLFCLWTDGQNVMRNSCWFVNVEKEKLVAINVQVCLMCFFSWVFVFGRLSFFNRLRVLQYNYYLWICVMILHPGYTCHSASPPIKFKSAWSLSVSTRLWLAFIIMYPLIKVFFFF